MLSIVSHSCFYLDQKGKSTTALPGEMQGQSAPKKQSKAGSSEKLSFSYKVKIVGVYFLVVSILHVSVNHVIHGQFCRTLCHELQ